MPWIGLWRELCKAHWGLSKVIVCKISTIPMTELSDVLKREHKTAGKAIFILKILMCLRIER